jgi:hypothetical protein
MPLRLLAAAARRAGEAAAPLPADRGHPQALPRHGATTMHLFALHQGIRYRIEELGAGVWRWSFTTPTGALRSGRVIGERLWAAAVACRAIEIWQQTHRAHKAA